MLAFLGFLTVVGMLTLVMTKKASPVVALIGVPSITGIIASFFIANKEGVVNVLGNVVSLGGMISSGIGTVAATGVMFIFSILFFGVLTDAGTFRPIIKKVLSIIGVDPVKVAIGTAVLAMFVHLDGSGAITFLICIPALLPVYDAIGMKRSTLAAIVALSAGTMNIVPWGGPTIRAATAMEMNVMELFSPVMPALLCGLLTVLVIAFLLGRAEKSRIGAVALASVTQQEETLSDEQLALLRPRMFGINVLLIIVAIVGLVGGGHLKIGPAVIFMLCFVLAVVINYPSPKVQRERVDAHAKSALMMASVLFAAGAFTGIVRNTGMITEMAGTLVSFIPASLGRFFPIITGLIAMPASVWKASMSPARLSWAK